MVVGFTHNDRLLVRIQTFITYVSTLEKGPMTIMAWRQYRYLLYQTNLAWYALQHSREGCGARYCLFPIHTHTRTHTPCLRKWPFISISLSAWFVDWKIPDIFYTHRPTKHPHSHIHHIVSKSDHYQLVFVSFFSPKFIRLNFLSISSIAFFLSIVIRLIFN